MLLATFLISMWAQCWQSISLSFSKQKDDIFNPVSQVHRRTFWRPTFERQRGLFKTPRKHGQACKFALSSVASVAFLFPNATDMSACLPEFKGLPMLPWCFKKSTLIVWLLSSECPMSAFCPGAEVYFILHYYSFVLMTAYGKEIENNFYFVKNGP